MEPFLAALLTVSFTGGMVCIALLTVEMYQVKQEIKRITGRSR